MDSFTYHDILEGWHEDMARMGLKTPATDGPPSTHCTPYIRDGGTVAGTPSAAPIPSPERAERAGDPSPRTSVEASPTASGAAAAASGAGFSGGRG